MIRPLAVSAVALCALYLGTAPSEAKWTPNNPKVALPSAARIAAKSMRLPRHVIQENTDSGDDEQTKKKKKKRMIGQSKSAAKKKNALANIAPGSSNAGPGNQSQQSSLPEVPHIGLPRGLDPTSVFWPSLKEIEDIMAGNGGGFDAWGRIFPKDEEHRPGAGDLTDHEHYGDENEGQEDGSSPADVLAGALNGTNDNGRDRDGADISYGIGAFGGGVSDPSGKAGQDQRGGRTGSNSRTDRTRSGGTVVTTWENCGQNCTETTTERFGRRGNHISTVVERKDANGSTTTRSGSTVRTSFTPSAEGEQNGGQSHTSESRYHVVDGQLYEFVTMTRDGGLEKVVIYEIGANGERIYAGGGATGRDSQPVAEGTNSGGGGSFSAGRVHCDIAGCWVDSLVNPITRYSNPGGDLPDGGTGTIVLGSRTGPGAATDPQPIEGGGAYGTGGGGFDPLPIGDPADPPEGPPG